MSRCSRTTLNQDLKPAASSLRAFWKGHVGALSGLFGSEGAASKWLDMVLFRDELAQESVPGVAFRWIRTEVRNRFGPVTDPPWERLDFEAMERLKPDYTELPRGTVPVLGIGLVDDVFPSEVGEVNACRVAKP